MTRMTKAEKEAALSAPPLDDNAPPLEDNAPPLPVAKPETVVWLNRLDGLLRLQPGHEGAAERIKIYADKVEADIGVRPTTRAQIEQILADIRGL